MPSMFPFLTSPLTPPSALPLVSPLPASASTPSFTTRDFLFLFPPHACTIVRSHRHAYTSHQREFHAQRLCDSVKSFSALSPSQLPPASLPLLQLPPFDSFSPPVTLQSVRQRLDDLCDTYLGSVPVPTVNELILTVVFLPLPGSANSAHHVNNQPNAAAVPSVPWCLIAHPRLTADFPSTLPRIAVSLREHRRLLPTRKHSQWIRDRQLLEQLKLQDEVGEVVMYADDEVLEGLITNVCLAEEDGGVRVCRRGVRLGGYIEQLLLEATLALDREDRKGEGEGKEEGEGEGEGSQKEEQAQGEGEGELCTGVREGLSVSALKAGKLSGAFITGSAVCIAGVQRVVWAEGNERREMVMAEDGLQRVDRLRVKLLQIMDQHLISDKQAAARARATANANQPQPQQQGQQGQQQPQQSTQP